MVNDRFLKVVLTSLNTAIKSVISIDLGTLVSFINQNYLADLLSNYCSDNVYKLLSGMR